MGVYIRDMEKPKICGECPLFIDHCYFDGNERHNGCFSLEREIFEDELAHDCPLIEIDLVRCGECARRKKNGFCLEHNRYERNDDGFCNYGERRADDRNGKSGQPNLMV